MDGLLLYHVVMNTNGYNLAVDIWSLGCTVLKMATSKPPWGQYEGVAAIFKIGNSKDMPKIPNHLSNDAKSFIKQCLQRDPSLHQIGAIRLGMRRTLQNWAPDQFRPPLKEGVSAERSGVTVEGSATFPEEAIATPPVAETKAAADEDDDSDVDFFGEETEEEKKAAEDRVAAVKASGKKKESGKSSVLMDIKPWMMRPICKSLRRLLEVCKWKACCGAHVPKLVPVGYGIKKLQIMLTIVDDLVSVDTLIEEHLTVEPINEYVQSCDIVAFNKIFYRHLYYDAVSVVL
ncbi:putative protein kinase STE-STE11 family [Helianthus annuus]|nr:putative protein kinase STE-STE11 family [Helianthus annuus]